MGVLPLLVTYLVVLKGYIHTIALYFYAYRPTFSGKNTAFSTILPCVLHQNVPYLAANHPKSGANGGFFK